MFQEPIHVLGSGSIGLLFAASIRIGVPFVPHQALDAGLTTDPASCPNPLTVKDG